MKERYIKAIIKQMEQAYKDDLPKTIISIFKETAAMLLQSHEHHNLCTLLTYAVMTYYVPREDILPVVEEAITMATEDDNRAMVALYHLIAGKAVDGLNPSSIEKDKHFDLALKDPAFLASVHLDDYGWLEKHPDSKYFNDDLLSFIGLESEQYNLLYDYYKSVGNRFAECYTLTYSIINNESIKDKLDRLMEVINQYGDLPVVCEAVKYICNHNLLPKPKETGFEADNEYAEKKHDFIKPFVDKFADDKHVNELKYLLDKLEEPIFSTSSFEEVMVPGQSIDFMTTYRNVEYLTVSVYPTDLKTLDKNIAYIEWSKEKEHNELFKIYTSSSPVYTKTYDADNDKPYITQKKLLHIEGLPAGIYVLKLSTNHGVDEIKPIYVTSLLAITECLPNDKMRIAVVDNMTGHPVPRAMLAVLYRRELKENVCCDENGELFYNLNECDYIIPYTETDKFCKKVSINRWSDYQYQKEKKEKTVEILTDRAIYRPGQTIHAAFVRYVIGKDKKVKTKRKSMTVRLRDSRSECICQESVKTDMMGVAHCDFELPVEAETGKYVISCDDFKKTIEVEEYKRPTFEVKMEEYAQPYKPGDTITVKGEARSFAGMPLANVKVKYRLKHAMGWWWLFHSRYWEVGGHYQKYGEDKYAEGEVRTDENGRFKIDVPLQPCIVGEKPLFVNVVVEADVIDDTGEMQSASMNLPLSNNDYVVHLLMDEQIECSEASSFTLVAKNATYNDYDMEYLWWLDDSTEHLSASSNQTVALPPMEVGEHVLHVKYGDKMLDHRFIIFDRNGMKTPFPTEKWTYQSSGVFPENGDDVILQVGCSEEDTYIFYNVFAGNKILESGAVMAASGMVNRRFSYQKKYGGAVLVTFAWVRNKCMQTHQFTITKPIPKRELQLSWKTFRDRVTSGSMEKWTLIVKDKDGNNVTANVMATLYDKSVDLLAPNSWKNFGPVLLWNKPSTEWKYQKYDTISLSFNKGVDREYNPYLFNLFKYRDIRVCRMNYISNYDNRRRNRREYDECVDESSSKSMFGRFNLIRNLKDSLSNITCHYLIYDDDENVDAKPKGSPEAKLRSDMSETAFFMPMLRTNNHGEVEMEFLLPDCLTTWTFKAIAHTRDMSTAYFEDETIASKQVMVQPNMPRFVRVGDETTISAKVTNTSGANISGNMVVEMLDASNEKVVFTDSQPFTLADNDTHAVSFHFTPDEEVKDYICRIYAVGEGFYDGEQHALRVLPNKTEVTVTRIITQDGPGTAQVATAQMFPSDCSRKHLTMQYATRPIWLAIDALPAMVEADDDNAISISLSIYCNLLTAFLQEHVKEYRCEQIPLSKKLSKSTHTLIKKLQKLQSHNGGFSWYEGMPESLYMTTEILMHLCRLMRLTKGGFGKPDEVFKVRRIIDDAFDFCDHEMCKWVSELRKAEKKGYEVYMPTFTILQHMYNCAVAEHDLDDEAKEAYDYLMTLLEKDIRRQTIREKAMSAVILEYWGKHDRAKVYAESLRQYTDCDEERGRTFNTPRASYSWYSYKIPTHVAGMEALYMLCPEDKQTLREMQKWLLLEKRTQMWETPIDTVNSVHALLLDAEEYLVEKRPTKFFIDGTPLDVECKREEGYVETDLPATTHQLSVEKRSKGLSWGAVFAQFLQPMSEVESSGSGMTITRKVLTDKKELHVGDRIKVKLTFTCDRNYDMVTVVDSKAACMEPIIQKSWRDSFVHVKPLDTEVRYSYYGLAKGTHSIITEYYLDRPGVYEIGIATITCTYAPEFRATCKSQKLVVY